MLEVKAKSELNKKTNFKKRIAKKKCKMGGTTLANMLMQRGGEEAASKCFIVYTFFSLRFVKLEK